MLATPTIRGTNRFFFSDAFNNSLDILEVTISGSSDLTTLAGKVIKQTHVMVKNVNITTRENIGLRYVRLETKNTEVNYNLFQNV